MNNLLWATVIYGALNASAQATTHQWRCADVPYWIKHYSAEQVRSTVTSLGMNQWEITRLLRCIQKGQ